MTDRPTTTAPTTADAVVERARGVIGPARPNPFADALESGRVPVPTLRRLERTLRRLVRSDRRSFALAAARFPDGPAGGLFLALAQGEAEALALLDPFGTALDDLGDTTPDDGPEPLTLAYPAFLTQVALTGTRSDVALALLANVDGSGRTYRRIADALTGGYGLPDGAVAHFRYLGDTPQELLDQARDVLADGLASGDDADEAVHVARTVHAFEDLFWHAMHGTRGDGPMTATVDASFGRELVARSLALLDRARYLSLATSAADGTPWSAVLQYAWLAAPLRFVVGSSAGAQHSRDVAHRPDVAGSLFVAAAGGLDPSQVDGAQFRGRCRELAGAELDRYHGTFYRSLFPDERERAHWLLPPEQLAPPAAHRLYLIDVDRWWLVDTRTWTEDRVDRRVEVPAAALARLRTGPRV